MIDEKGFQGLYEWRPYIKIRIRFSTHTQDVRESIDMSKFIYNFTSKLNSFGFIINAKNNLAYENNTQDTSSLGSAIARNHIQSKSNVTIVFKNEDFRRRPYNYCIASGCLPRLLMRIIHFIPILSVPYSAFLLRKGMRQTPQETYGIIFTPIAILTELLIFSFLDPTEVCISEDMSVYIDRLTRQRGATNQDSFHCVALQAIRHCSSAENCIILWKNQSD